MKKSLLSAALVLFLIVYPALAQQHQPVTPRPETSRSDTKEGIERGMHGKMMDKMGKKKMMSKMCPMGDMMKMMMNTTLIATSDGGVVVLRGNVLAKYDKDLNFVKEVQLKDMTEEIQQKMQAMMKECPMMKNMDAGMEMEPGEMDPGEMEPELAE